MWGKNMSPKKDHNLILEMPNLVRSSFFHILRVSTSLDTIGLFWGS